MEDVRWLCGLSLYTVTIGVIVCIRSRGNVWTHWQNHSFTNTSTLRSSTCSPSTTPMNTQLCVNSVTAALRTLIDTAHRQPWAAETSHILSDILHVQTVKFQPCETQPVTNDQPGEFQWVLHHTTGCVCYSGSIWVPCGFLPNRTHWSNGELGSEATGIQFGLLY